MKLICRWILQWGFEYLWHVWYDINQATVCASKHVDTEHRRWITMTETVLPKAAGQDDDRRVWHMELRKAIRTI